MYVCMYIYILYIYLCVLLEVTVLTTNREMYANICVKREAAAMKKNIKTKS